jgi:hypothetical protein
VRNGSTEETGDYIDAQTTSISVGMVAYAPDYGLASTIWIHAKLSAGVQVDFEVQHFQSIEGDLLDTYRLISIAGFVLAVVILIEKVYTIYTNDKDLQEVLPGFVVDLLVQVILPVIYFGLRLSQVTASRDIISGTS